MTHDSEESDDHLGCIPLTPLTEGFYEMTKQLEKSLEDLWSSDVEFIQKKKEPKPKIFTAFTVKETNR